MLAKRLIKEPEPNQILKIYDCAGNFRCYAKVKFVIVDGEGFDKVVCYELPELNKHSKLPNDFADFNLSDWRCLIVKHKN